MMLMASELKLGDVVDLGIQGFSSATVVEVGKLGEFGVRVIRPYVVTADMVYTGGVPWSIGIEDFRLISGDRMMKVLYRETKEFK
jgi:hypothetical protein